MENLNTLYKMIKTKHFVDDNHLVRNAGYVTFDDQINRFISKMSSEEEVIDIKYSSVFNCELSDIYGRKGIMQFSALLIYK